MSKETRKYPENNFQMLLQLPEKVSSLRSDIYFHCHFDRHQTKTESHLLAEAKTKETSQRLQPKVSRSKLRAKNRSENYEKISELEQQLHEMENRMEEKLFRRLEAMAPK